PHIKAATDRHCTQHNRHERVWIFEENGYPPSVTRRTPADPARNAEQRIHRCESHNQRRHPLPESKSPDFGRARDDCHIGHGALRTLLESDAVLAPRNSAIKGEAKRRLGSGAKLQSLAAWEPNNMSSSDVS